ncbi:MAG TPA: efflux RND transporter periplasmic adaptor subunit [Azospirillaceae bacterium]|nr:efflux RND transporter periplasmic adaptor subunit [Azospirillaceae bacterium]
MGTMLPSTRRSRIALAVGMALAVGVGTQICLPTIGPAQAQNGPPAPPAPKVRVMAAEQRQMAPQVEVPGTVHSRQDARIAAEIAGRVVWVAEVGTQLAAGGEIARIDDRAFRLELSELEAQIRSLQSQHETATREAARLEKLAATGNAPQARLEEAVSKRDVTAQDLVRARAQRDQAALNVERASVRAPFAGQVAARMVELGEYSNPGKDIARLVATGDVEVRVQAPITTAAFLSDGMTVPMQVGAQKVEGTVSRIIPVAEKQSRTFEVRLALPQGAWVVGSAVKVALPAAAPHAVVAVHRDALILRGTGAYVYRVKEDQSAERVPVEPGIAEGEYVEVVSAVLKPGDQLVVRGGERLKEGQKVDLDPKIS